MNRTLGPDTDPPRAPAAPTDPALPLPSPAQIELVRASFALVEPIADTAAQLVYQRIFELAPAARAMFGPNLDAQGHRLMQAVAAVVRSLDDPARLVPFLERLGARHVGYGVVPAHFDVVGEALLWALATGLGDAFTEDVRAAWVAAYGTIRAAMTAGMTRAAA